MRVLIFLWSVCLLDARYQPINLRLLDFRSVLIGEVEIFKLLVYFFHIDIFIPDVADQLSGKIFFIIVFYLLMRYLALWFKNASSKGSFEISKLSRGRNLEKIPRDVVILSRITYEVDALVLNIYLEIWHMRELFPCVRSFLCLINNIQHVRKLTSLVNTQENFFHSENVTIFEWVVFVKISMHLDHSFKHLYLDLFNLLHFSAHWDI